MRSSLSARKRALRYAMFFEERCGKLSRAAPFPWPDSHLGTGFAKFLHQQRETAAFQCPVFPDLVSQLHEFRTTVLVLNNHGTLFLGADLPLSNGIHKRGLKKAECFVNSATRSIDWLSGSRIKSGNAKIFHRLTAVRLTVPMPAGSG